MTGKQVEINKLKSLFSETIEYYEDTGYPFARLAFYDQKFEEDTLSLTIDVITGPLMLLDSLVIKSKDNIGRRYLVNYLDLQEGNAYSESKIQSLSTKLKEISFIESQKSPEVLFTKSGADVYLYLNSKKANTFNGILGFQPDNETGEIAITGDIDLKLENALNKGERFNFQWKRLQTETQELSIQLLYPYVINTQIGISTHVDLYRRDTTYSELITGLSLLYLIRGNDHLKILFESKQSNSLAVGVGNLSLADSETKSYGVGLLLNRLDYKINPSKGYQLDFEMALGTKSLKVPDPEDLELELESTMTQFRLGGEANAFIPIGKRNTIRFRSNGGWIKVPELFENEMMRIGGLRTVRGFDESSILASAYVVGTLEYRFLLDETSAAYAFFDQCWYENDGPDKYKKDTPYGFGIGINFQTGPGIFTLTYALGSQFHGPILFRNAKVHFGFVSLF
jgi:hemolysin activation/secretion protein